MKKILLLGALFLSTMAFSQVQVLTSDTNWSGDVTIDGKVVVNNGVTLTIEPGTVIKAVSKADPSNASALVVAKGGKLMAEGTAKLPIIFTTTLDPLEASDVAAGTYFSSSFSLDLRGQWGGLILLGDNVIGANDGTATIEGIGAGNDWAVYGGNKTDDNSGVLKYISIRHGGATVAAGNEINGLTLGGVGNGTTIENIEIISNNDDGIELFGGNVDVTNILIYNQIDDAIDIDQAYSGTITNAYVAMGIDSDNVFEIDGSENATTGSYTIDGVTAVGKTGQTQTDQYGHWKSSATGANNNIVFKGFAAGTVIEGMDSNFAAGTLTFSNIDFVTTDNLVDITSDLTSANAEVLSAQAQGTGANSCVFSGWTAYSASNSNLCSSLTSGNGNVVILSEDTTWSGDVTIDGKVVVDNGVTLTIAPGTVIKATSKSDPSLASALVVAKGGKLMAEGNANLPIVFTTTLDPLEASDVAAGTYFSSSFSLDLRGQWGGLVLLGDNVIGANDGTATIEGVGAGNDWAVYGGNKTDDNSGVLKYISIRHGGATVAAGNEINGLTLGGVGNGTTIENIEIISNNDDGIELFGGNVDVNNILIYNQIDDAIDIDQAYSGTITNAYVAMGIDSDNVFEIDGSENATTGSYTIDGVTAIGKTGQTQIDQYGHWKSSATGANNNIVFKGFAAGTVIEGMDSNFAAGTLTFSNIDFVTTDNLADITSDLTSANAEVLSAQDAGTGSTEDHFYSWTAYFVSGEGVLSVEDTDVIKTEFSIYPNPFSNVLNVSTQVKVDALRLYNITGQLVKANKNSNSIDVSELSKGMYILEVITDSDREVKKVIKK